MAMATTGSAIKMRIQKMFHKKDKKKFSGSNENFIKNGSRLLEESISLFDGRTNPIRCLSVDELNSTIVLDHPDHFFDWGAHFKWYPGVWEGNSVLLAIHNDSFMPANNICLAIAVSAQMGVHKNALRLLGCCLETEHPVLIFEGAEIKGTLNDRLFGVPVLEWKDRLRIAWEISNALAYLHTAFPRPIVYRDLSPNNVFLDQNNVAKLSDFSLSISIPKGKTYVEDMVIGTSGFAEPGYMNTGRITEKVDVYCFGVLLLMLLTGKRPFDYNDGHRCRLWDWAPKALQEKRFRNIIDPAIRSGKEEINSKEIQLQLRQSLELGVRCISDKEDSRPTMVEVATQLKSIIRTSESVPSTSNTQ